jgi:short-subunit dehydrogenase
MLLISAAAGYLAWKVLRPRYDFRGRNVLITGGSRGLGLVMARQLAVRGARLGLMARDEVELFRAVKELKRRGATVSATVGDLKDRTDIRRFISESRGNLGPVDVLINNAGVIGVGPLETMTEADFDVALRTHFWATLYTTLEVIPEMKSRGAGRILNIASFGGKIAVPHMLPYTASKFAQVGLSNGLRAELARFGIVVTTVCPGLMRTGGHSNAEFKGQNEQERDQNRRFTGIRTATRSSKVRTNRSTPGSRLPMRRPACRSVRKQPPELRWRHVLAAMRRSF